MFTSVPASASSAPDHIDLHVLPHGLARWPPAMKKNNTWGTRKRNHITEIYSEVLRVKWWFPRDQSSYSQLMSDWGVQSPPKRKVLYWFHAPILRFGGWIPRDDASWFIRSAYVTSRTPFRGVSKGTRFTTKDSSPQTVFGILDKTIFISGYRFKNEGPSTQNPPEKLRPAEKPPMKSFAWFLFIPESLPRKRFSSLAIVFFLTTPPVQNGQPQPPHPFSTANSRKIIQLSPPQSPKKNTKTHWVSALGLSFVRSKCVNTRCEDVPPQIQGPPPNK